MPEQVFTFTQPDSIDADLFQCTICLDTYTDPVQHLDCRFVLCRQCLVKSGNKCPTCKKNTTNSSLALPDPKLIYKLEKFEIECQTCSLKMPRGSWDNHKKNECTIECPTCKSKIRSGDKKKHDELECEEGEVLCEAMTIHNDLKVDSCDCYWCGPRKNRKRHMEEECKYKDVMPLLKRVRETGTRKGILNVEVGDKIEYQNLASIDPTRWHVGTITRLDFGRVYYITDSNGDLNSLLTGENLAPLYTHTPRSAPVSSSSTPVSVSSSTSRPYAVGSQVDFKDYGVWSIATVVGYDDSDDAIRITHGPNSTGMTIFNWGIENRFAPLHTHTPRPGVYSVGQRVDYRPLLGVWRAGTITSIDADGTIHGDIDGAGNFAADADQNAYRFAPLHTHTPRPSPYSVGDRLDYHACVAGIPGRVWRIGTITRRRSSGTIDGTFEPHGSRFSFTPPRLDRIAPLHTHTPRPAVAPYAVGDKVEYSFFGTWTVGTVTSIESNGEIRGTDDSSGDRWNVWASNITRFLAPLYTHTPRPAAEPIRPSAAVERPYAIGERIDYKMATGEWIIGIVTGYGADGAINGDFEDNTFQSFRALAADNSTRFAKLHTHTPRPASSSSSSAAEPRSYTFDYWIGGKAEFKVDGEWVVKVITRLTTHSVWYDSSQPFRRVSPRIAPLYTHTPVPGVGAQVKHQLRVGDKVDEYSHGSWGVVEITGMEGEHVKLKYSGGTSVMDKHYKQMGDTTAPLYTHTPRPDSVLIGSIRYAVGGHFDFDMLPGWAEATIDRVTRIGATVLHVRALSGSHVGARLGIPIEDATISRFAPLHTHTARE